MANSEIFENLVGKTLVATAIEHEEDAEALAEAEGDHQEFSVNVTVDSVKKLDAVECEESDVKKDPFSVVVNGPLDKRLPARIYSLKGDGVPEGFMVYIDPLVDLNPEDDKIPYEFFVA